MLALAFDEVNGAEDSEDEDYPLPRRQLVVDMLLQVMVEGSDGTGVSPSSLKFSAEQVTCALSPWGGLFGRRALIGCAHRVHGR